MLAKSASLTITPLGYAFESISERTVSPLRVLVLAMSWTMTSWLTKGRPRQFMVMKENRRCSILFHLLVPGGKWHTRMRKPVSCASRLNSSFHNLTR